jgi:hypothetical protein
MIAIKLLELIRNLQSRLTAEALQKVNSEIIRALLMILIKQFRQTQNLLRRMATEGLQNIVSVIMTALAATGVRQGNLV